MKIGNITLNKKQIVLAAIAIGIIAIMIVVLIASTTHKLVEDGMLEEPGLYTYNLYDGSYKDFKPWNKLVEDGDIVISDGVLIKATSKIQGKLILSNDVVRIGQEAFDRAFILELTLSKSVEKIDDNVLERKTLIQKFNVSSQNEHFTAINGSLYTKDASVLIKCAASQENKSVKLPQGVKKISDYAFYEHDYLEEIVLPNGLVEIGKHAFDSCEKLQSITMPNSVTSVGEYAFYDCESLQTLTLSNNLNEIPQGLCCGCISLEVLYYQII